MMITSVIILCYETGSLRSGLFLLYNGKDMLGADNLGAQLITVHTKKGKKKVRFFKM